MRLTLGGHSLSNAILNVKLEPGGALGAVIGAEVLRRFNLKFDRRWLHLEANPSITEPFAFTTSGLGLSARAPAFDQFLVEAVYPDSPAADAGIKIGDQLLEIDSKPASEWTLPELRWHLRQQNHHCRLFFSRDGETYARTLVLRKLL